MVRRYGSKNKFSLRDIMSRARMYSSNPAYRGRKAKSNARARRARYGRKPALKGFTKLQSKTIMRAIKGQEETKYIATQLATQSLVDSAIHTPGTDILPLVPVITPGSGEFQRTGRKVSPTRCKVDVSLTFQQLDLGTPSPDITTAQANAIYVVLYILRSKSYKCWNEYLNASTPEWNYLLDDGAGNAVPFGQLVTPASGPSFWATNTAYLQYPVDTSHYTLVKKRVVKLVRNQGMVRSAVSGEAPNLNSSFYHGSFSYRLPKLIYDDTERSPSNGFPTNANLMLAVGYAFADNLWSQDQIAGPNSQASMPLLNMTIRNHVWYKDA